MNSVDIAKVRDDARRKWKREHKRDIPFLKKIEGSVQWWLIIIAAVMFALSAPHTASVFNQITPGFGWLAPLGVEFGLLYAAFQHRHAAARNERVSWLVWALEVLLFVVAIIVNGVGALQAVISNTTIHELSIAKVFASLGDLKIGEQVALSIVPLAALVIPVGTAMAGLGLAGLIVEHNTAPKRDDEWEAVKAQYEFEALRDAAIQAGDTPRHAAQWARAIAQSALEGGVHTPYNSTKTEQTGQDTQLEGKTARERAIEALTRNPALFNLSFRELERQTGIPKSAWEYAKKMKFPVDVERKE